MDVNDSAREVSEGGGWPRTENLNCHKETVGRNMNVKGTANESSGRN